jgi:hypothetical protein
VLTALALLALFVALIGAPAALALLFLRDTHGD